MTWKLSPSTLERWALDFKHEPVLIEQVIEGLHIKPDGIYADGTLGGGGHSFKIIQKLESGRLIGIDQDEEALASAKKRLSIFENKVTLVHDNYVNMPEVLKNLGIEKVDGILLDIGVSSYQIDNPERGFSYMEDSPLDMRMDKSSKLKASDVVNGYSKKELSRIIRLYGEEQFANNIAKHIVNEREKSPLQTTGQLLEVIDAAVPQAVRKGGKGPAKRTFQAIRIEVNKELDVLQESIEPMINLLNPGGRLLIITFHSLEDRIVKTEFKRLENPCTCPPDFPVCTCGKEPLGKVITRHPIIPDEEEVKRNRRAASAKLRIFERK